MLLLKRKDLCPQCGNFSVRLDSHSCDNCHVKLFKQHDDFGRYEQETLFKHYYVWFNRLGWVYSDKLSTLCPNKETAPESILASY